MMKYLFKYLFRKNQIKPERYRNLIKLIYSSKSKNILEVGVFNGKNSQRMIEAAKAFTKAGNINYYGFDLFETQTEEDFKNEFSKKPLSEAEIRDKLSGTGANIHLSKGNSQETIPAFVKDHPSLHLDFIYIDGGHNIETIRSDWHNLEAMIHKHTIVVFDDYFENDEPEIRNMGCNDVIDNLDPQKYHVEILKPQNQFEKEWGTLKINFVKVVKR